MQPEPPPFLQVDPGGIPDELKALRQWLTWKAVWDKKRQKWKKVPINPHTGRYGSSTDPATWGTFDEASARMGNDKLQGVGFVFTADDPYAGIDLDEVVTDGVRTPYAQQMLDRFPTYAETSPTQSGYHLIMTCTAFPEGRKKLNDDEVYQQGRFFTMTGHPLREHDVITECTQELFAWHAERMTATRTKTNGARQTRASSTARTLPEADRQLLDRCRSRWRQFGPLFDRGDLSEYGNDHSSADLGLLSMLVQAGVDRDEDLDRLFRASKLNRKKWCERPDYRARTIAKARESGQPPDPTTCDAPHQLRRQIGDLEAELRCAQDRLAQYSTLISQMSQIRSNRGMPQARVAQTLVAEFTYWEQTGKSGPYPISVTLVASKSGVHRNTAGRHIREFAKQGLLRIRQVFEQESHDLETGEVFPARTVTYLKPTGSVRQFAEAVSKIDLRARRNGSDSRGVGLEDAASPSPYESEDELFGDDDAPGPDGMDAMTA